MKKYSALKMTLLRLFYLLSVLCVISDEVSAVQIDCIQLKLCPMALKLIDRRPFHPSTISFLRYSHCGFDGREPKVWCNKFLSCKTPDAKNGTCTEITKCKPYLHLLKSVDVSNPITKKYLRAFRCTTEHDPRIEVCCPDTLKHPIHFHDYDYHYGGFHTKEYHAGFHRSRKPERGDDSSPDDSDEKPGDSHVIDRFDSGLDEVCGKELIGDKIVGGTETELSEYPWIALLKYDNGTKLSYGCTGSLINSKYILTAAHCVDPVITTAKNIGKLAGVILGEYDIRNATDCFYTKYGIDCADPVKEFEISSIIRHPGYGSTNVNDDIALIRLKGKVIFTEYIRPICLPSNETKFSGNETFEISGWGKTENNRRSPTKRKATIPYRPRSSCNRVSGRFLTPGQICAGLGNGTDSCFGDSGGPLMLRNQDTTVTVMGIISYGYGGACGQFPSVYTLVPYYMEWIKKNMRAAED